MNQALLTPLAWPCGMLDSVGNYCLECMAFSQNTIAPDRKKRTVNLLHVLEHVLAIIILCFSNALKA